MIVSSGGGRDSGAPGLGTTHLMSALQGKRPRLAAALNGASAPPLSQFQTQQQREQAQQQQQQQQPQLVAAPPPEAMDQRAAPESEDTKTRIHGQWC